MLRADEETVTRPGFRCNDGQSRTQAMDGTKMLPRASPLRVVTMKRFQRCKAVSLLAIFICSVIAINMYTDAVGYQFTRPSWLLTGNTTGWQHVGSNTKVRHVVFLKVHKAASTTLMNIFVRYGLKMNLTMMIPLRKNILNEHGHFTGRNVLPPMRNRTYDMLYNHVIFNKTFIKPLFPPDTKYIAILREPFEQTVSAFMYYKYVYPMPYLWNIDGENPVSEYLKNPRKYEPLNASSSFTNNRMSVDLGFPDVWSRNLSQARDFIRDLGNTFHLILIAEYFDESIVLMKRLLKWEFKDILYISSNSLKKGHDLKFTPKDRERHRLWAWLDHMLYDHYYQLFWDKIHAEGKHFFREVQTYKEIRHMWQTFCSQTLNRTDTLKLEATKWSSAFEVSSRDCNLATTAEIPLMEKVRINYYRKSRERAMSFPERMFGVSRFSKSKFHKTPKTHHLIETKSGRWIKVSSSSLTKPRVRRDIDQDKMAAT
ncbi:galactose-3-O-sulfotransferase 2-like [Haliotis rubra]|uniref:galactose-3-O-sulfotransferase 2-like n=1 Tax=Haliotis rubra TaxID=36100 RepID=UPI001EE530BC|nr:galactose-3-O-sulfotransferase 2-like [Haliotis rubra]